jgi:hypothetical protein
MRMKSNITKPLRNNIKPLDFCAQMCYTRSMENEEKIDLKKATHEQLCLIWKQIIF